MSSTVCQELQLCPDLRIVEPSIVIHKLTQPKSKFSQSLNDNCTDNTNKNGNLGGWSFIQALTNPTQSSKEEPETQKIYVHPLVKRSSSVLSLKSLEMCTESLGSETGSEISESSDEFSPVSWEKQNIQTMNRSKSRDFSKKPIRSATFPPPLTSISCSESVRVRPHRENGRLVIKAVAVSSSKTFFQTERTDGRLRLSLLKEQASDDGDAEEEFYSEQASELEHGVHSEADDDDDDDDCWGGDIDGNVGGEMEIPRPSRCKEGGRGRNKEWGQFWVAIS